MEAWDEAVVLADSQSLTGGEPVEADISGFTSPTVLVDLEDLEAAGDDTATIRVVGAASTYTADERTLGSTGSYTVDVTQAEKVEFESSTGVTYSVEVRANA